MKVRHFPALLAAVLLLELTSGCSAVYHQKWRRAARVESADSPAVGRWEGTWSSEVNQHRGKLRCIVSDLGSGRYDFHYWAAWSLFAASYHLELPAVREGETTTFSGSKNLGWLAGGLYSFKGTIQSNRFRATYQSTKDRGRFEMNRVSR